MRHLYGGVLGHSKRTGGDSIFIAVGLSQYIFSSEHGMMWKSAYGRLHFM